MKQVYETLIASAQEHGGKLPVRTNFLLDEFANMPPLKDVTTMITAARSRRIRFTMIIQNFAQLDQVYGKENAETIRGNCGNTIYLITTELKALEEISKMCGEVKSKKDDKTASTPLVTVSDLQRMKQFEVIILRMRKQPFKTKFTPYYQLDFGQKYPKATYPQREKQEVHTFDIREFVKEKKRQKLFEMMEDANKNPGSAPAGGSAGGAMPMFSPMGGASPFGAAPMGSSASPFGGVPMGGTSMFDAMGGRPPLPPKEQPVTPMGPSSAPMDNGINMDDLVRKIDAKLAAIDAEEKKNSNNNKPVPDTPKPVTISPVPKQEPPRTPVDNPTPAPRIITEPVIPKKPVEEVKVIPEPPKPIIHEIPSVPEVDTDDDNFFDDFFDDQDE